jgi:hypothetical protein
MVEIGVTGETVVIRVLGSHKLWALRRRVILPRRHVVAVKPVEANLRPPWLRFFGTAIPGIFYAGLFWGKGR